MLEVLTKGFRAARQRLRGETALTETNIDSALRDLRRALLEADVSLDVAKRFLARVKEETLGQVVKLKAGSGEQQVRVSAGDHFTRICQEELTGLMGGGDPSLNLAGAPPAVILLVGLQGSGKTTTAAKLARNLSEEGHKPLLVAADIYRPAAIEQLKLLGERLSIPVFSEDSADAPKICSHGVGHARANGHDVVLLDTAGRLVVDEPLMRELEKIASRTKPNETLLICDAMIGQEAVTTATVFHERLELTGAILTKMDGDARGGAALSVREVTGVPIKFVGMGEGLDRLEPFRPDAIASRILGMGDVEGLMSDFARVVDDEAKAEETARRALQGEFDFEMFLDQIQTLQKMGSLSDLVAKLPFFQEGGLPEGPIDDAEFRKAKTLIQSMTRDERRRPSLVERDSSRRRRICKGSGSSQKELKELLKKYQMMRNLMGMLGEQAGGGLMSRIPGMKRASQLAQLRNLDPSALAAAGGGAGLGPMGLPGDPGLAGGFPGQAGPRHSSKVDRSKQKSKRKAARKARKRGKR
jgi:signal recognition particle subunit SRP54